MSLVSTYMEYWSNPIKTYTWPCDEDPIVDSFHNGQHCLFFDPIFNHAIISYRQKLQDLCNWANNSIQQHGINKFLLNEQNHYDIANLVKLNIWINDIKIQGIVKPMLISYNGNTYTASNGESRLRCLEKVHNITSVSAFINTSIKYQLEFSHLERVTTFDQYAKLCNAIQGQKFLFRLTDNTAPWGLDWYEYDSKQTGVVTPGQDYCVAAVTAYLEKHPTTKFTPEWFSNLVDWNQYKNF
jgi:hypothetical protein